MKVGGDKDVFHVFGDVHGQYHDMLCILDTLNRFDSTQSSGAKFMFLGDYVDRGEMSFETIMFLFCWKVMFPNKVYLLRGNHEDREVNTKYGFLSELQAIFGQDNAMIVHGLINDVFDCMPLAATLYDKFFCVHGGLSNQFPKIEMLEQIQLPCEIGPVGSFVNDLLWSDPDRENKVETYIRNPGRGPKFGQQAVNEWCKTNNIERIFRAHQTCKAGAWTALDKKVVTVFSAPNYGRKSNLAGVLIVTPAETHLIQFQKSATTNAIEIVGAGET